MRAVTSSETSRRERVEIWSTRGAILGDNWAWAEEDEEAAESSWRRGEVENERKRIVGCILKRVNSETVLYM